MKRCAWARSPAMIEYHDREWGVPVHDDRVLFEFITLEGAQAGLSWETILNKREAYRRAFADFDPAKVARFTAARRAKPDAGRRASCATGSRSTAPSRTPPRSSRSSASSAASTGSSGNSSAASPRDNRSRSSKQLPARTELSDALSKELKRRGFRFVGTTICYAFMQAVGIVNDHTVGLLPSRTAMSLLDPQVLAFALVAALMTISPGADTFLVVRNTLRGGRRDGWLTVTGICSGLFVHALLSALGVSAILAHSATAFLALKVAGAAYLAWLGIQSLRTAARGCGRDGTGGDVAAVTRAGGALASARDSSRTC